MSDDGRIFLKTFLNIELYFFSDRSRQEEAWANAEGEQPFIIPFILFDETWDSVLIKRDRNGLPQHQIDRIQKLRDMLKSFLIKHPFPARPQEYLRLLDHDDWRKIQRYAKDLHETIKVIPDPEEGLCPVCQQRH